MKNVDLWLLLKFSWKKVDLHFLLIRDSWSWAGLSLVTTLSTTSYCLPMYCLSHQDETLKFVAPRPEVCWSLPHPNKGGEEMQGGEKYRCQGACSPLTPQSHMITWKKTLPHWVLGHRLHPEALNGQPQCSRLPLSVLETQKLAIHT